VAGRAIRLGRDGSVDVAASVSGDRYQTTVHARLPVRLRVGVTLPTGKTVDTAQLNGRAVRVSRRRTNRGLEVTAAAAPGAAQRLVITTR